MAFLNAHRPVHLRPKKLDITDFKVRFESIDPSKIGFFDDFTIWYERLENLVFSNMSIFEKNLFSKLLILRNLLISRKFWSFRLLKNLIFLKVSFYRKYHFLESVALSNITFSKMSVFHRTYLLNVKIAFLNRNKDSRLQSKI